MWHGKEIPHFSGFGKTGMDGERHACEGQGWIEGFDVPFLYGERAMCNAMPCWIMCKVYVWMGHADAVCVGHSLLTPCPSFISCPTHFPLYSFFWPTPPCNASFSFFLLWLSNSRITGIGKRDWLATCIFVSLHNNNSCN